MLRGGGLAARPSPSEAASEAVDGALPDLCAPNAVPVALVELARRGDRAAFGLLVERRLATAYRTARAILGDESDARDATQEAFLHAWRDMRRLRDAERFDAWFGRILVNSCRQAMRGRRRRTIHEIAASDLIDHADGLTADGEAPEERAVSLDALERAFDRLSADERAVLVLHHLERRRVDEIGTLLGVPTGTVKSRLHSARHKLERALEVELR